jgi:cytochrome c oxidase cbb3-type subunit I/II
VGYEWHRELESRGVALGVLAFLAVSVGGLALLVPPYFMQGTIQIVPGVLPYTALELEGRDLYIREGCNTCHSQQVRPLKAETDRYGPFSLAGEGVYDRPFLWGSRRTGPDLARVGGKYPDSWHWLHLRDPRALEPHSNMPAFEFLTREPLDTSLSARKLAVLRRLGHPYSDAEVSGAQASARAQAQGVADSLRRDGLALSELEAQSAALAVIAYLQRLGRDIGWRAPAQPPVAAAGDGRGAR